MAKTESEERFIVGVSIVVVPDGFVRQKGVENAKLSLSLSPTGVDARDSVASVDIRFWPEQIARLARSIRLHIEGQTKTPDCLSDLDLEPFAASSTALWRCIFSDGAGGIDPGFDALLRALRKRAPTEFDKKAKVESSPVAQLGRLIDGVSASAVAASLLQRAASAAAGPARTRRLDAVAPGAGWWNMLRDEWLSPFSGHEPGNSNGFQGGVPRETPADDSRVLRAGMGWAGFDNPSIVHASSDGAPQDGDPIRYLMSKIGEPEFWRSGEREGQPYLGQDIVRRFRGARPPFYEPGGPRPTTLIEVADTNQPAEPEDPLRDNANRKYAGLLCFPTLAKYLGLIVDTAIEADYLRLGSETVRTRGKIAASFTPMANRPAEAAGQVGPKQKGSRLKRACSTNATSPFAARIVGNPNMNVWTAYVFRRSADRSHGEYFGPLEMAEESSKQPGGDGLLKLGVGGGGEKARFELSTLDVTNAVEKILDIAKDSESRQTLEKSRSFPELLTRGIVLADKESEKQEEDRKNRRVDRYNETGARVLYAEHLVLGYRIDVVLTRKLDTDGSSRRDRARWRTLVGRSLNYGRDVDRAFMTRDVIRQQRVRDDGHVKPMTRLDGFDQAAVEKYRKCAHQELFTWTGESLAIPHVDEANVNKGGRVIRYPGVPLFPEDLTVDLIYDLPGKDAEAYRRSPPLRENHGYMFGARVHFLNGCCLDFAAAVDRYAGNEPDLVLGKSATEPFIYRRRANVHAPDVLLPWNDGLVTCPTRDVPRIVPGETIFELVIRTGRVQTETASRFLVPPRVTFDLAEQSGLFDHAARPRAAFAGKIKAIRHRVLGVFPVARAGGLSFPDVVPEPDPCAPKPRAKAVREPQKQEESRGSVLVLDGNAAPSLVDFFADPMARQVGVCFVEGDLEKPDRFPRPDLFSDAHITEFWPVNADSSDALPVILRLKKGRRGEKENQLGWFEPRDQATDIQPRNAAGSVRLRQLTVVLVPGAKVNLELFSLPYCKGPGGRPQAVANALDMLRQYNETKGTIKAVNFGVADHHADEFHRIVQLLVSDDKEAQDKACEDLLSKKSLEQVTTKRIVTVVHAVDRPPQPRFITADGTPGGAPRFFPVSIKPGAPGVPPPAAGNAGNPPAADPATDKLTNLEKSWHAYVDLQEKWDGFVVDGILRKPTLDEHCQPLDVGKKIDPSRLKDKNGKDKVRLERACWDSEEGGITTFFAGEILIDRLTTGRVRCEARWSEYSPAIIRQDGVGGRWIASAKPPRYARLFEIDDIEPHIEEKSGDKKAATQRDHLDQLDLLRKNTTNLRYLAHPFVDGRARHLTLQLVATSRFTNYFPPKTNCESATPDFDHSKSKVWAPCTFRPSSPEIDHILPVFHWKNEVHDDGQQIRWTRTSSLRLFMGRDWYSSGEGESLGLVCWPENLLGSTKDEEDRAAPAISRRGMSELDPTTAVAGKTVVKTDPNGKSEVDPKDASKHRYGQFVTRWGADPIHLSGALDAVISADRFANFNQKVTKNGFNSPLLLSLPDSDLPGQESTKPLSVCLLTYEPTLDAVEGTWSADIRIDHGASYFPFVQLGLVRYQAHAVNGLEMSYPVAAVAQIPPRRQGQVTFENDYEFEFELSGIGFYRSETEINPNAPEHDSDRYRTDVPVLDIKLMSAAEPGSLASSGGRINWQPVLDRSRRAIEWLEQRPVNRGAEVLWTRKIKLPVSRRHHRYALLIEEFEYMSADRVKRDASGKPSFSTEIVRRGPVFSHIVDLGASCP